MSTLKLEVLISTYLRQGLERIGRMDLPEHAQVRYLVCCQTGDEDTDGATVASWIPPSLAKRRDVDVHFVGGKGVAANRRAVMRLSTAPYLLIGDDDVTYTGETMDVIIGKFDDDPMLSVACFMPKQPYHRYPSKETLLNGLRLRRHYPQNWEIALRRSAWLESGVEYDTLFGINAGYLESGEEDVFFDALIRKGLKTKFFPIAIFEHPHPSTGYRAPTPGVMRARGAVLGIIHPHTFWLRIPMLAVMLPGAPVANLRYMIEGLRYYRKQRGRLR